MEEKQFAGILVSLTFVSVNTHIDKEVYEDMEANKAVTSHVGCSR